MTIEINERLKYIADIVEARLLDIQRSDLDEEDYDNEGWWVIGNSYLFLYNKVINDTFITDQVFITCYKC